ncbi:hypothetical protein B7494_g8598 [Chlorociboria aeruginascens]|nr:hypothetical protein B7494_g8598 [Chlorociboria aeruginascens]
MVLAQLSSRQRSYAYQQPPPPPPPSSLHNTSSPPQITSSRLPTQQLWNASSPSTSTTPISQPLFSQTLNQTPFSFGTDEALFDFDPRQYSPSRTQNLMPQEHTGNGWQLSGQLTPTSQRTHHRESSSSTLGSAGPASPYNANTSNPQVAGEFNYDFDYHPTPAKPLTPHTPNEPYLTPQYAAYPNTPLVYAMANDGTQKTSADADLMPAPRYSNSVTSVPSVASHESPQTPPSFEEDRRRNGEISRLDFFWVNEYLQSCDDPAHGGMPHLSRTTSDAYNDELYRPPTAPTVQVTSATTPTLKMAFPSSSQSDLVQQRVSAANIQRMNTAPLSVPDRGTSPFRYGSPLAPTGNSFGSPQSAKVGGGSATQLREQAKAEHELRYQQQSQKSSPQTSVTTISPRDLAKEYNPTEEDSTSLFPEGPPQQRQQQQQLFKAEEQLFKREASPYHPPQGSRQASDEISQHSYGSMATSRRESSGYSNVVPSPSYNFATPASATRQPPNQYPFVRRPATNPSTMEFPTSLTSMDTSVSDYVEEEEEEEEQLSTPIQQRPAQTSASSGTYSCTYQGCPQRFESAQKLQKHKREGHRNSALYAGSGESGMTSAAQLHNTQNGPHRCDRVNPSTGKPCNISFSRPYDLTRHEDTIHNPHKQKLECRFCSNEKKTFSRNDALTRHMKIVHPDEPLPGKHRRRDLAGKPY